MGLQKSDTTATFTSRLMLTRASWSSQLGCRDKHITRKGLHSEMRVQSLGLEDPLEEEMATQSSVLAWRIPMDRGDWWATVHGVT